MISFLKKEYVLFFTALMFYTRLPCPKNLKHSNDLLNESLRYFPIIGYIVAFISSIIFLLSSLIFSIEISILLSMLTSILITGAFHEDGLADMIDGFGGGWSKDKILDIMKDSRIGTFGVIALIIIFLLKYQSLLEITKIHITYHIIVLFIAHSLSRLMVIYTIQNLNYVRENDDSKIKPIAKNISFNNILISSFIGYLPLFYIIVYYMCYYYIFIIIILFLLQYLLSQYFKKWIGGYTGDCLGSIQQISEIIIYLYFLSLWKFI